VPFSRAVYANRLSRSGPYRRGAYSGSYVPAFSPLQLSSLRAWYDAELGQPRYGGAGAYVQLDGTSGDYIYTPDSAATSFSNDIEVVMRVKVTDWTAAGSQTLAGKYVSSGNQRSWRFYVNSSGNIGLSASTNGTAVTTVTVTPTVALPDATWIWLRMRLDLTDGANSVGTLETAADDGTNVEPGSWTANGTNTSTTIASVFDSTAPTEIGTFAAGTLERLTGQVGRCIVRAGFAGTTVADFNASDCYGDGYSHADGYRWNLGLPKIYDRGPNGLAPATFGSGSNQPKWLPWEGRSQVYLPGAAGNSVSTPHVTHTGDFVARVQVRYDASTASFSQLIGDRSGGSTAEAQLRYSGSTALLSLQWFESSVQTDVGTAASIHGLLDGQVAWLGVERINNNGGVYRVRFYKSLDESPSLTDWIGWTLISEHNGAVPAAPTATTNIVSLGGPNNPLTGGVLRAVAFNNGVQTVDFVAASCGQSGYTDTLGNVWTVNRSTSGRKIVVQSPVANSARSVILHGTDDRAIIPNAAIPPMPAGTPASMLAAGRRWATVPNDASVAIFDTREADGLYSGVSVRASGESVLVLASDGVGAVVTGSAATPYAVTSVNGVVLDSTTIAPVGASIGTGVARTGGDESAAANAALASLPVGAGGFVDGETQGLISLDSAITETEHGLLTAYYRGGL